MINSTYSKAYTEVLEIIKYFSQEDYNRIPKEKIEFYENNRDKNYNFKINPEVALSEQNISSEANAIIVNLFNDYFATEEQKIKIKEILELNQKVENQEKYSSDSIFKTKDENINIQTQKKDNTALIEHKETFFSKFRNFVFKILHIKK